MLPAIVHLIGPPAAGKLTVARAFAEMANEAGHHTVVLDNHHTTNVIFSVIDVDGIRTLPPSVWDRIGEIRESMLVAIEELSPPDWTFVFTNVLGEDDPVDQAWVERTRAVAEASGRTFVPVHLTCEPAELARRAANDDRRARMKWIDGEAIAAFAATVRMLRVDSPAALDLDTTERPPSESAALILAHVSDT
ncbi:MAG: hypothetical protein ACXIVQ_11400 [Acidimicrobiales bacterium]